MHTLLNDPVLPDTPELRERLAGIIAKICSCEPGPLLADQEFTAVVAEFDSLAVLEILLEIETAYGIETDEMLPINLEDGAQDLLSAFPENLSELTVYLHEVVARRPQRAAELQARIQKTLGRTAVTAGAADGPIEAAAEPEVACPLEGAASVQEDRRV